MKRLLVIVILILGIGGFFWYSATHPLPKKDYIIGVEDGQSIFDIARTLKSEKIIKYKTPLHISYFIFRKDPGIKPGAYELKSEMSNKQIVYKLTDQPWAKYITLEKGLTKAQIGEKIGEALGWNLHERQYFSHTYAGMQWQHYQEYLQTIFPETYKWTTTKTQTFLSLSALYNDDEKDFFKTMYVPGTYEIQMDATRAQIAGILIDNFAEKYPDSREVLDQFLDKSAMDTVAKLIEGEMILMPDIVSLPPLDITLKKEGNISYLLFTTSYWNKGRGPLELVADPKTKGIRADVNRNVYQRIYHLDGDYTERLSGKFLWHQPHLHYHFEDFAVYNFDPVEVEGKVPVEKQMFKSTFCVRDSEPIDLAHPGANKDASYKICGKERQGISTGWADSYYYTYVDQRFNVSNYPAGTYRIKISINPKDRFDEVTLDNNVGETIFYMDVKNGILKVIEEKQYGL